MWLLLSGSTPVPIPQLSSRKTLGPRNQECELGRIRNDTRGPIDHADLPEASFLSEV